MTLPVPPSPCPFPDRERLALLDAAGRLEGDDLARWDAHLSACAACAERAARDAADDAALASVAAEDVAAGPAPWPVSAPLSADGGPARDDAVVRARARRRWLVLAAAAAAVLVVATAWLARRATPDDPRARAFRTALALSETGRYAEALAAYRTLLAERPEYAVKVLEGHALLRTGRAEEAAAAFRAALAMGVAADPLGQTTPAWYVQGHLAQALVAAAPDGRHDAEVERIVREAMDVPGLDAARNRCVVWTLLARARAFGRGDVAGGEAALVAAERDNLAHRREAARAGRPDLDCHYVLQARFAFAQAVRADSDAGRRAAVALRDANEAAADLAPDASRAESFLAEAAEAEALAELLAARRGDAADLATARERLAASLAHREKAGNPEGLARTRARLAWLELLEGRADAAVAAATVAEADAERSGTPDERFDARLVRAQALLAAGRPADALEAVAAARATPGATEVGRALALAAVEANAAPDAAARARARDEIERAVASPLRDVARVAARLRDALDREGSVPVGPSDVGFRP